ncbi:MAG: hypothetical protein N2449_10355 [Bacteroidales bacterium]|nr:hypothetical protein [Bacteroidales bacterium]
MKRLAIFNIFVVCFIIVNGQNENSGWKGYVQPDYRVNMHDGKWLWNENRLSLQWDKKFEEKARFVTDIWFRTLGNPNDPAWLKLPEVREAKIEVYDFIIPKLDLTLGRQRMKWGTADKINPTDNINPHDLEDIWDFGRHKPSDALSLKYYPTEKTKMELVYAPFFQPIQMPAGVYSNLLMPEFSFPDSMSIRQKPGYPPLPLPSKVAIIVDTLTLTYQNPAFNINHSAYAFRFSQHIKGIDISASYHYGFDGIPVPSHAYITVDSMNLLQNRTYISVNTTLEYPKFHRIGLDFTTSVKGIGLWGEACLTIPDKNYLLKIHTPDLNQILGIDLGIVSEVPDSVIFKKNKPWTKFVIGADYTFENGIYVNMQYLHGFLHERTSKELNDYYLIRMEKRVLDEKIKLAPVSGGLVINDYKDVSNNYAWMWIPEFVYYPNDNTEIATGVKIIDGKGKGTFNSLKDLDEVYLRIKYSF